MQNTPPLSPGPRPQFRGGFVLSVIGVAALGSIILALGGRHVAFGSTHLTLVDDGASSALLARRVHEAALAAPVTDEQLRTIVDAIARRAEQGDPDAALFMLELARRQRADAAPR